jgi:hypothetical protein
MDQRKDKIALIVIRLLGVLAGVLFITVRSPAIANFFLRDCFYDRGDYYGDSYLEAKVLRFKQLLPEAKGKGIFNDPTDLDRFQLISIGDSFFNRCRGYDTVPYLLSQRLQQPVFYNPSAYYNPFELFKNIRTPGKRILILDCAERMIVERFLPDPIINPPGSEDVRSPLSRTFDELRDRWFVKSESNYQYFLRNCFLTSPIIEIWNSLNFEFLNRISKTTPVYSVAPPVLFLYSETEPQLPSSFYYPHSDQLISTIADHFKVIKDELFSRYNTELIFMPIPNKYTIEHKVINSDAYDDFLPKLYAELEKRNVRTVRLYEKLSSSNEELYFPTDTHWNGKGVSLALDELLKVLRSTYVP